MHADIIQENNLKHTK